MKKKIYYEFIISVSIALVVFSIAISSCNFKFGDPSLLTEPTVDYANSILTISIPRQSKSTQYINVYRQDVTDAKEDEYDSVDIINIGLILPENLTSGGNSFQFQDSLVKKSHKYRYRVRYCESSGYYSTEWSDPVEISSGQAYKSDDVLTYTADGLSFDYDETYFTLTLNGAVTSPSVISDFADYTPALIVKIVDSETVKVFEISSESITSQKAISLRGILTSDFFDSNIQILGIVAQKKQYANEDSDVDIDSLSSDDSSSSSSSSSSSAEGETSSESEEEEDEKPIMRIIWTEPVSIPVTGHDDNILSLSAYTSTEVFDFSQSVNKQ